MPICLPAVASDELPDVLAIQDEISRGIVNSLRLTLGRGRRRYEISPEVYDSYLHARAVSVEPRSPATVEKRTKTGVRLPASAKIEARVYWVSGFVHSK